MIKKIPSFDGYYVSSAGNVYSRKRRAFRKLQPRFRRYAEVQLSTNGKIKYMRIHRLVLETFVGHRPKNFECRHLNDKKRDNRLSNLVWGSRLENMRDRVRNLGKTRFYSKIKN